MKCNQYSTCVANCLFVLLHCVVGKETMSYVSSVAVVGYTKEGLYLHIQGMAVEGF